MADAKSYMPVKLPLSREAHINAIEVSLEATNTVLPSPLCADPKLPLVATLTIFKATLDSNSIVPKHKEKVTKVGNYFAKWLATIAALVDKNMPIVVSLYEAILCGQKDRQRGLEKTLLFNITCRLAHKVPLTKLVELDGDIHVYLIALMAAALMWVGEALVVLKGNKSQ